MLTRLSPRPGRTSVVVPLIAAVAGFGAGAAALWLYNATPTPPDASDKPSGTAADVVALGRLRPASGLLTVSGPLGDQIARIEVKEGDAVQENQPLVELAGKADRAIEVALLEQQLASAEEQQKLAVVNAEREAELAKAKVEEFETVAPLEIQAQEARLDVLLQQQATATDRLKKMEQVTRATVPEHELQSQRLLVAQAEAERKAGDVLLKKARAAHENGLKVAKLQLDAAQAGLQRARTDKSVEALREKLKLAKLQLERSELRAPWAGTVLKVTGVPGEATAPQVPILQMADTRSMVVVAEVYETDIERLRQWGGAKATVQSRAFPSDPATGKPRNLTGRVTRVGRLIARNTVLDIDPTADADRRVFEVLVALDGGSNEVAGQFLNLQVQVFFEPAKK
jgi:HlyD family secretion protein